MITTVWVFVFALTIGGSTIDACPNMQFVFANKATCEYAIEKSKGLRCIEVIVSYAR